MTSAKSPGYGAGGGAGVDVPAGPCGPWAPVAPVAPVAPGGPVAPVSPLAPGSPLSPLAPGSPLSPLSPFSPLGPTVRVGSNVTLRSLLPATMVTVRVSGFHPEFGMLTTTVWSPGDRL